MIDALLHSPFLLYAVAFIAAVTSTSLGVGSPFLLLPLAAIQFGPKEGVGIMSIFFLFQNINKWIAFRHHINWPVARKVILWSLPGVLIGSLSLAYIPADLFKKILAVLILIYLLNDIFKVSSKQHTSDTWIPGISFLYGFLSGLIGTGNVLKGPLFVSLGILKEAYLGTYAVTSFFMNVPKIVSYSATGIIDGNSFIQAIPFLFISIIGTWIGKRFLRYISGKAFYYILMASFAVTALMLLFE